MYNTAGLCNAVDNMDLTNRRAACKAVEEPVVKIIPTRVPCGNAEEL